MPSISELRRDVIAKVKRNGGRNGLAFAVVVGVLLLLDMAMFADVLFWGGTTTLSKAVPELLHEDVFRYFGYLRDFAFRELRNGNLALWNPHMFSGLPAFGNETAVLYPPNVVYLVLPLAKAINADIAISFFLSGVFMCLWMWHRRLHPLACLLGSALFMFCGPVFMRMYPGHITNLCAIVWVPLVLLAIDGLIDKPSLGWCLLGMFAVTMQVFADSPQPLYYTGLNAMLYTGLNLIHCKHRLWLAAGFVAMYTGAVCLASVQLLTQVSAGADSLRSGGLSYAAAAVGSFPPENFLTLLAPGFFGRDADFSYWGSCVLFEMTLFVGVTTLFLAVYGAVHGDAKTRRFSVVAALVFLVLAMGAYTPLFGVARAIVPGYDLFRGSMRFKLQATVYVLMLAAIGFDRLVRQKTFRWWPVAATAAVGLIVALAGLVVHHAATTNPMGWWHGLVNAAHEFRDTWRIMPEGRYADELYIASAGLRASRSLFIASGSCLVLAWLFFLRRFSHDKSTYALLVLAIVEIMIFARSNRPTFDLNDTRFVQLDQVYAEGEDDFRLRWPVMPSISMWCGTRDIWGHGVGIRRYVEFIAFTQREPLNLRDIAENDDIPLTKPHRLFRMLRCRFFMQLIDGEIKEIEIKNVLPRLQLIGDWTLLTERNAIFAAMLRRDFDPARTVILESTPDPEPVPSEELGTAVVVDSSTDHLVIEADVPQPAILLITDAYSSGWRAWPLPGSVQDRYEVMPANYVLRAIPLAAGKHRLRVEYLPWGFVVGKWVSICSLAVYISLSRWWLRRRFRQRRAAG